MDPLEAEEQAVLLGAKLAQALYLQVANLLTDNQILASTVQASSSRHNLGHWSLTLTLA